MENFEDIKVDDKVIIINGYYKKVAEVRRVTNTLIVVDGCRFNKSNGMSYGDRGYLSPWLKRVTPEAIAEIKEENKRKRIISNIKGYPWDELSTEELEKVYELINK